MSSEARTLEAGTVVKINGFPVKLNSAVEAESANWSLIDDTRATSGDAPPITLEDAAYEANDQADS